MLCTLRDIEHSNGELGLRKAHRGSTASIRSQHVSNTSTHIDPPLTFRVCFHVTVEKKER